MADASIALNRFGLGARPDERAPGKLVIRGAGWGNSSWCLRAAYRHSNPPVRGLDMVGLHADAVARLADDREHLAPDLPAVVVGAEGLADLGPRKAGAVGVHEGAVLHGSGFSLAVAGG